MAYQIIQIAPRHCPITDGIVGAIYHRLPTAYETKACAFAIAGRLADDSYQHCGDDSFNVIVWGGDVRKVLHPDKAHNADPTNPYNDEIPF
jgi:hypothetical protein